MRRTKEDAAKTRQSVIDAALRLFGQRGYSGTTLRLIAEHRPLPELVTEVLGKSGLKAALENEDTDESADRLGNLEELISAAQDFLDRMEDRAEATDDLDDDDDFGEDEEA